MICHQHACCTQTRVIVEQLFRHGTTIAAKDVALDSRTVGVVETPTALKRKKPVKEAAENTETEVFIFNSWSLDF